MMKSTDLKKKGGGVGGLPSQGHKLVYIIILLLRMWTQGHKTTTFEECEPKRTFFSFLAFMLLNVHGGGMTY